MASIAVSVNVKGRHNQITKQDCLNWLTNTSINPQTGRKITPGASTYNKYASRCATFGIYPKSITKKICSKLWEQLTGTQADSVGLPETIYCKKCEKLTMNLYAVHNNDALDIECPLCGHNADVAYFCKLCRYTES